MQVGVAAAQCNVVPVSAPQFCTSRSGLGTAIRSKFGLEPSCASTAAQVREACLTAVIPDLDCACAVRGGVSGNGDRLNAICGCGALAAPESQCGHNAVRVQ